MGAASIAVNRRPRRQGKLARFDGMRSEKPGRCAARLAREDSADYDHLLAHTDVAIETRLQVLPVVTLPSFGRCEGSTAARQGIDPAEVDDSIHGILLIRRPGSAPSRRCRGQETLPCHAG